jgi:phosphoenolpyruvate-protein kinase (PTS system EI component)
MDLGGDKMPRFGDTSQMLALRSGLRGLAFSLAENNMFRTQLAAIVRAARHGNVKILFPMVMGHSDLAEACRLVQDVCAGEGFGEKLEVGAMIETPAAVFAIDEILDLVDLISIGTNDLAHFILGMHRATSGPTGTSAFFHPSVLRSTQQVIEHAQNRDVPVTVCGEAVGDPATACLLIGMGVRALSINPLVAARLRRSVCRVTTARTQALARQALNAATAGDVGERLAEFRDECQR